MDLVEEFAIDFVDTSLELEPRYHFLVGPVCFQLQLYLSSEGSCKSFHLGTRLRRLSIFFDHSSLSIFLTCFALIAMSLVITTHHTLRVVVSI